MKKPIDMELDRSLSRRDGEAFCGHDRDLKRTEGFSSDEYRTRCEVRSERVVKLTSVGSSYYNGEQRRKLPVVQGLNNLIDSVGVKPTGIRVDRRRRVLEG